MQKLDRAGRAARPRVDQQATDLTCPVSLLQDGHIGNHQRQKHVARTGLDEDEQPGDRVRRRHITETERQEG